MNRDLVGKITPASSIDPDDYTATVEGAIIDLKGYDSAIAALFVGTLTDGVHTPKLEHGNDSGLTDAADVAAGDLDGEFAVLVSDTNQYVGYRGNKRYIMVTNTITGGPGTGVQLCGAIIRGKAGIQN